MAAFWRRIFSKFDGRQNLFAATTVLNKCRQRNHAVDVEMSKLPMRPSNSKDDGAGDQDTGFATTTEKPQLKQPPLYKVVLINDDYTPMDFVVDVLRSFFSMNVEKATQVMLKVHTEGKGVCGVFSKDVAESKATQVNEYSRDCEQPLLCSVEVDR